ncbi:MAG: hypothetical protein IJ309_03895 [Clostridia bacterium]|nr:hypothetical protein [Clostridia bacterium]
MKLNWKNSLAYFLIIQATVLVIGLFINGPFIMLIRFSSLDTQSEDVITAVAETALELLTRFIVIFAFFKNNRSLTFPQFCIDYSLVLGARLVFSLCTHFAFWSAGGSINLWGAVLGNRLIGPHILTMLDVPIWLYLIVFFVFEGLFLLSALGACKIAAYQRKRVQLELFAQAHNNNTNEE